MVLSRFQKQLAAVMLGNLIYFGLLSRILPPVARHDHTGIDLGLLIDFGVCVGIYFLLGLIVSKPQAKAGGRHGSQ